MADDPFRRAADLFGLFAYLTIMGGGLVDSDALTKGFDASVAGRAGWRKRGHLSVVPSSAKPARKPRRAAQRKEEAA